jgi:hypothetical protein
VTTFSTFGGCSVLERPFSFVGFVFLLVAGCFFYADNALNLKMVENGVPFHLCSKLQ